MKLHTIAEPELQFSSGTHIDIRAGIATHGAFDKGTATVPNPIGIGLVGTTATVDGVRDWLEACRNGVVSSEANLRELRPDFPGMHEGIFGTRLALSDAATRSITRHELHSALSAKGRLQQVVEVFMNHARDLASRTGLHVIVIAPPSEVFELTTSSGSTQEEALDDGQDEAPSYSLNFHDVFKAQALDLGIPCQLLRPDTYGLGSTRRGRNGVGVGSLQDEATRAWNFHTALYYKSGGVPWRLVRHSAALSTCYVGASFFKSVEGDRLLTSVAQVFDERGEGLIVQGGNARIDRDDRSPHLSSDDARALLASGLATYRREHKTMPARVLLHKTSYFNDDEIAGFREASNSEKVELLDLVSVRRAGTRLLRAAVPPAVRGTSLVFDDHSGMVYLKGTVPYFRMYPGMYVPRALEFTNDDGDSAPLDLAKELLELSKLNFNNTQFDSGDPITIRAARRVGDILKHVAAGRVVQSRFRYFT